MGVILPEEASELIGATKHESAIANQDKGANSFDRVVK